MLVAATVIEVNYNCHGDNNESQRGLYMTSILDVLLSITFFLMLWRESSRFFSRLITYS